MSEYLIQKDTLVSIADPVRELAGVEDELSPATIATKVAEANETIASQATTISEIAALLEGKSVSGGGGTSVETCTVTINNSGSTVAVLYTAYGNDVYTPYIDITTFDMGDGGTGTIAVAKGQPVYIIGSNSNAERDGCTNCEKVFANWDGPAYYYIIGYRITGNDAVIYC